MIVNIIKLYGLPEKIIIRRTQVRSLVYFFFYRFLKVNLPWSDI